MAQCHMSPKLIQNMVFILRQVLADKADNLGYFISTIVISKSLFLAG